MPGSNKYRRSLNIALSGGSGFLGRSLLPLLTDAGHQCTVLTRNPERCRDLRLMSGVSVKFANPNDTDSLGEKLSGHDVVINLVGILNESGRGGKGFKKAHVDHVRNLVQAGEKAGATRFIQVSALGVNTDSPNPSHYLISKREAEEVVQASSMNTTIFRPSVLFGVDDSFFNRFADLLQWIPIMPLACPNALLQPVWVGDVAQAITLSVASPETHGMVYPLVGPTKVKLIDLVRFTARKIGKKRLIFGLPDFLSRLQGLICDFVRVSHSPVTTTSR